MEIEVELLERLQLLQEGLTLALSRLQRIETAISKPPALMLSYDEVCELTGLCRETIWRKAATGKMPKPVSLGHRTKRFRYSDIKEWVESGCLSVRSMKANRLSRKPAL